MSDYTLRGRASAVEPEPSIRLYECDQCGALIYNMTAHTAFHARLDAINRPIGKGNW